jgi:outer membrane protein OmpA-like peptidoglycan-associated protein
MRVVSESGRRRVDVIKKCIVVGSASLLLAVGCATTPKNVYELAQARSEVARLANDPIAAQSASRELQKSREALDRAEEALKNKEPREEIVHLAYLAKLQAEIGSARLAEFRARQQIADGEAERNAVLLQAREREARLASSQAAANEQAAEAARQAARLAEQRAQANRQQLEQSKRELAALQAKQTDRGMVLTLGDVLFDTDQADLKPGAGPTIDRLAQFLRDNEDTRLLVEGYTDSRGSEEYNQDLSRRRAAAVASALESRGIARDRVNVAGRGETLPVASNDTAAGRQLNRRVEIVFSDQSGNFASGVAQR